MLEGVRIENESLCEGADVCESKTHTGQECDCLGTSVAAGTHSDSARFVNPEMPFHCRKELKRFRRPVSILCG